MVALQIQFRYVFEFSFMNGSPIRNPKAESYVRKLPALDGSKMTQGRKAEIEAWMEYLEIFLPSFEPILGSFWSRMLRCVPDSVSLRFEFSFHE